MKNSTVSFFRLFILFVFALSFSAFNRSAEVHADEDNTSPTQESALDSVASCDNQDYGRLNLIPVTGEGADLQTDLTQPLAIDKAVLADVGLNIEEISEINEIDNTFTIEGIMDIVWCDPRLKYDNVGQHEFEIFVETDAQEKLDSIWGPDLGFANEVDARDIADQELVIHENGSVNYHEKFTAVLEGSYHLKKFPFDQQNLRIEVESFAWDEQYLQLNIEENAVGLSEEFELSEWSNEKPTIKLENIKELGDRERFSQFVMSIDVTRQSGYYIWKVLFPLVILVMMCFAVFWMDDESLSSRLSVSFTGVLTVVAYQFIATSSLPKVSYITLMDTYITFSFVIMVLTIVQSLVVNVHNKNERKEKALRVDRNSRFIFPLIYVLGTAAVTAAFLTFG